MYSMYPFYGPVYTHLPMSYYPPLPMGMSSMFPFLPDLASTPDFPDHPNKIPQSSMSERQEAVAQ